MPRVSDEHRAARRRQILDAATRCFVRNGFHATSMQDVIREADLSVGAFYGYFRSKTELIRAIAEGVIAGVIGPLDAILATDPLPPLTSALDEALGIIDLEAGPDGRARIAVQVWGEAIRDPELGAMVRDLYGVIRQRFVAIAVRARDSGQLPADTDPETVGIALFGVVQGYILQRVLIGSVDRESYLAGVTGLLRATPADPPRSLTGRPA